MRIEITGDSLGKVGIHYRCENEDCTDPGDADVDPTFFEVNGTPICSECGEDMCVFGVTFTGLSDEVTFSGDDLEMR